MRDPRSDGFTAVMSRRLPKPSFLAGQFTGDLLAVIVRAAIITVPWIVGIIIRRIVSVVLRLRRANPVIDGNVGAAVKQKCKSSDADHQKDRYDVSTCFLFSCHAFGALI